VGRLMQGREEAMEGDHPQVGGASELPASLLPAELFPGPGSDDLAAPAKQSVDDESNGHATPAHERLGAQPPELNNLGRARGSPHPKPHNDVEADGMADVAESAASVLPIVGPGPAARHPGTCTLEIFPTIPWNVGVVLVKAPRPLQHVARHILQAIGAIASWRVLANCRCPNSS
jgi:hypothetical protein